MELGRRIRQYRMDATLSQEELAERIFVTRQTVSNWENDKSYPDIKSLVLLSEVFHVSLDQFIKGDLEKMKEYLGTMKQDVDPKEYAAFRRDSAILTVFFAALIVLPIPLAMLWRWFGMALYLCLFGAGLYFALRVEKYKRKWDIQTWQEITAFMEGKPLNEIEKAREEAKRPYQKALLAAGSGALVVVVALIVTAVIRLLS